jgi:membrane-associated phospholipid phosphatase
MSVDTKAYTWPLALFVIFAISAALYDRIRKDVCISSMLFGFGFVIIYGASLNVISYFGLTIAGPRIDDFLASIDRHMGIYWPALILFMAKHPTANAILFFVYRFSTWQTVILIAALGRKDRIGTVEQLCLTLVLCGIFTIGMWMVLPSFGAIAVYGLPSAIASHLPISVDQNYAQELLRLWTNGPGLISPLAIKGLVGFPSFHAAQAVIVAWYARRLGILFYPFLVFNILVIVSTPVQGGHHVVDVIGGIAVAALAIWLVGKVANRLIHIKPEDEAVPAMAAG